MIVDPDKAQKIRIADREFLARGLKPSVFGDLFHHSMRVSWPLFFAAFAVYFLTMNLVFASLFHLGGDCIANARPGSFLDKSSFPSRRWRRWAMATCTRPTLTPMPSSRWRFLRACRRSRSSPA